MTEVAQSMFIHAGIYTINIIVQNMAGKVVAHCERVLATRVQASVKRII